MSKLTPQKREEQWTKRLEMWIKLIQQKEQFTKLMNKYDIVFYEVCWDVVHKYRPLIGKK